VQVRIQRPAIYTYYLWSSSKLTEALPKTLPKKVQGYIKIALIPTKNPNRPLIMYEYKDIDSYKLPTLLRQVAKQIEDEIIRGGKR